MGGTYAPENVVLLTVPQHAEAHHQLFLEHGRPQDKLAWLMLSGCSPFWIPRSMKSRQKQGQTIKGHPWYGGHRPKGYRLSEEAKKSIGQKNRGRKIPSVSRSNHERIWTDKMRKRVSARFKILTKDCGSVQQYWRGCRCLECRSANTTYGRRKK